MEFRWSSNTQTCPVCGMKLKKEGSPSVESMGKVYYFCSDDCKTKFTSNQKDHTSSKTVEENCGKSGKGCC